MQKRVIFWSIISLFLNAKMLAHSLVCNHILEPELSGKATFSIRTSNRAHEKGWLQLSISSTRWSPLWVHYPIHRPLFHCQCQHQIPRGLHLHQPRIDLHRVHLTNQRADMSIPRYFIRTNYLMLIVPEDCIQSILATCFIMDNS